jgi:hypothetical protein
MVLKTLISRSSHIPSFKPLPLFLLSFSYIYMYIYTHIYTHIWIYIYIYFFFSWGRPPALAPRSVLVVGVGRHTLLLPKKDCLDTSGCSGLHFTKGRHTLYPSKPPWGECARPERAISALSQGAGCSCKESGPTCNLLKTKHGIGNGAVGPELKD